MTAPNIYNTLEVDVHDESRRTLKNEDIGSSWFQDGRMLTWLVMTEKYDNPPDGLVGVEGGS